MVVSVHPSLYLAGAGRAGRAGQEWWCLFVYLSCKAGAGAGHGAGQGRAARHFQLR